MRISFNKAKEDKKAKEAEEIEDAVVVEDNTVVEEPIVETQPEVIPEPDYKTFNFGNLMITCGRCSNIEMLEEGVEGGIQVILPTTDKHKLELQCPKCKNFMRLHFTENFTKTKEIKNEPESEDQEKESVQGVPEDSK